MRIMPLLISALALSACVGSTTSKSSVDRQARSLNAKLQAEANQTARNVRVGSKTFKVAVVSAGSYKTVATDRSLNNFALKRDTAPYATVDLVAPQGASYNGTDVEAAARAASGCNASFQAGILTFFSDFSPTHTDLSQIAKKSPKLDGWRTNLQC